LKRGKEKGIFRSCRGAIEEGGKRGLTSLIPEKKGGVDFSSGPLSGEKKKLLSLNGNRGSTYHQPRQRKEGRGEGNFPYGRKRNAISFVVLRIRATGGAGGRKRRLSFILTKKGKEGEVLRSAHPGKGKEPKSERLDEARGKRKTSYPPPEKKKKRSGNQNFFSMSPGKRSREGEGKKKKGNQS